MPKQALVNMFEIPAGSHIKTLSPSYGIDHHGIFAGVQAGRAYVFHSIKPGGFVFAPYDEFHHGLPVEIVESPIPGSEHQRQILDRARMAMGTNWTLLSTNCEHLARWVFSGVAESRQVQVGFAVSALVAGLVLFATDDSGRRRRR